MSETKNGSQYPGNDGINQTGQEREAPINQNNLSKAQLNNLTNMPGFDKGNNQKKPKNPEIADSNSTVTSRPPSEAPNLRNVFVDEVQGSARPNTESSQGFNFSMGRESSSVRGGQNSEAPDFGRSQGSIGNRSWTSNPETPKAFDNLKQFSYGSLRRGADQSFGPMNSSKNLGRVAATGSEANNFGQGAGGSFTQFGLPGGAASTSPRPKPKNKLISRRAVGPQVTYEEIGLFPRSFSRVFDRFFKQIFSDVENLVIQEYRFYRYLFLTTIKTLCILFFVPFAVNFIAKTYLIRPITEYFWNTQQTEIFLNSYEQKRAFAELEEFEEKLYFESLLTSKNAIVSSPFLKANTYGSFASPAPLTRYSGVSDSSNNLLDLHGNELNSASQLNRGSENLQDHFENQSIQQVSKPWGLNQNNLLETKLNLSRSTELTLTNNNISNNPNILASNTNSNDFSRSSLGAGEKDQVSKSLNNNVQLSGTNLNQTKQFERSSVTTWKGDLEQSPTLPETLGSLQEKILELAIRYNNHSIEAITNFFADFLSLMTLLYLLVSLEIQINITKSFLLEVFFGLDDSKKSLLILIMTDLLVGYHSSNLWELFFQFIFNHYGIPESQTGIFLLVATLPVLLDVLFKYLIFRHLNRSSPATVATYHAIIE